MKKSIYLTRKKADFSHDQFVRRWRQHGALAMSKSLSDHMMAYVQAEIVQPAGLPGATQDYDAIAYIIARDHEVTPAEIDELKAMVVDEYETFFDAIVPHLIRVEERIVKAGPIGGTSAFLFYLDSKMAMAAVNALEHRHADRLVLNMRLEAPKITGLSSKIPYQAVVEVAARDLCALGAVLANDLGADLFAVTQECVMWNRLSIG